MSGNKKRISNNDFDLDLTKITDRIIVHGFPAAGIEHLYRNPRYEVRRYLETYHRGHYYVFNFCCEPGRGYDASVFENRVMRFPFKDHCVPPLETMVTFANAAKAWLDSNELNVCSLHCKAGKGRAGIMACVLLLRAGYVDSAEEAIRVYDATRVTDGKGLTMTSQRKFVNFYEQLWRRFWCVDGSLGKLPFSDAAGAPLVIPLQPELTLRCVQLIKQKATYQKRVCIRILQGTSNAPIEICACMPSSSFDWLCNCIVRGNFKIEVLEADPIRSRHLLDLWHNTLFIDLYVLHFHGFLNLCFSVN